MDPIPLQSSQAVISLDGVESPLDLALEVVPTHIPTLFLLHSLAPCINIYLVLDVA